MRDVLQAEQDSHRPRRAPEVPNRPPPAILAGAGNRAVSRLAQSSPAQLARFVDIESAWHTATTVASEFVHGIAGQELEGSVGFGGRNHPRDVLIVERLLSQAGINESNVGAAIMRYQKDVLGWDRPDGRVDPGGRTFRALTAGHAGAAHGTGGGAHGTAAPGTPPAAPAAAPAPAKPATPAAAAPPAPFGEASGVEAWPSILPTAKRGKKEHITLKKGDEQVNVPEIAVPELTDAQKTVFQEIKANRAALPTYAMAKATYHGWKGYARGESGAGEKLTPTELQGESSDPATKAKKAAYKELGHEGTVDSINTYDDQIVTWGKGWSAKSGSMNEVLELMFQSDPEAKHVLLRAGIDMDARTWRVVNEETGMIETGNDALRLMQFDTRLLSVFVTLGRDPKHQQHALDAQWTAMQKGAAHVPEYAYGWQESSIALAAHLAHWSPAFGWGYHPQAFADTKGDLVEIVKAWARLAKHNSKYTTILKNAAFIGPYDFMQQGHRLLGFADGAGGRAVQASAHIVSGTPEELGADAQYAGHFLIPVYNKKHQYYDIPL
ncbi:MAG: hypothetical protein ACTHNU_03960 [Gaiellales bacterium]